MINNSLLQLSQYSCTTFQVVKKNLFQTKCLFLLTKLYFYAQMAICFLSKLSETTRALNIFSISQDKTLKFTLTTLWVTLIRLLVGKCQLCSFRLKLTELHPTSFVEVNKPPVLHFEDNFINKRSLTDLLPWSFVSQLIIVLSNKHTTSN